jgi:cell division protein FtsN
LKNENGAANSNNNVSFHVQIGAYKNQPTMEYFKQKYAITEEIITDIHNGLNKYMVGKFNEYKSARDHRESTRAKGLNGAFVTAYNFGKRITVQEALMMLNQKWFK